MVNLKQITAENRDISKIHNFRSSKENYKRFSTRSEKCKNYNSPRSIPNTFYTIVKVSILRVTASLEKKNAANVEKLDIIVQIQNMGNVDKRKEKN